MTSDTAWGSCDLLPHLRVHNIIGSEGQGDGAGAGGRTGGTRGHLLNGALHHSHGDHAESQPCPHWWRALQCRTSSLQRLRVVYHSIIVLTTLFLGAFSVYHSILLNYTTHWYTSVNLCILQHIKLLPVSRLMVCLRLVSMRRSTTSWANSSALRMASFCLPWLRSGEEGRVDREEGDRAGQLLRHQPDWCVCVCVCVCRR